MALEAREIFRRSSKELSALSGVKARLQQRGALSVSSVEIINKEGAEALHKPIGRYYTIDIEGSFLRSEQSFSDAAQLIAQFIRLCFGNNSYKSFLIAALGNPDITPDAVGSIAASNILVTEHLKAALPQEFAGFNNTMLCRTGVLGTSGIESARHIRSLVQLLKPDCVIAIDALAGAELKRLCRSIQISSSGIAPGSGVGNSREELSQASLGVPVVALGVPTVIDAASFSDVQEFKNLFVTPRDIDSAVRSASRLAAYGINLALHPGLSLADIDMLVG